MTVPQDRRNSARLRHCAEAEAVVESFLESAVDRVREVADNPLHHPIGSHPELVAALVKAAATVYLAEALCESIDQHGDLVFQAGATVAAHIERHGGGHD